MKILVHDYAGHPFQVQLSRALARRGHEVVHSFASALQTPRGALAPRADDPPGLRLEPVPMDPDYGRFKYSFRRRRGMERRYGRAAGDLIRRERPEVVVSANTPTEAQSALVSASREVGAKFHYWLQDFYSVAVGKLLRRRLGPFGALVGLYYRALDRAHLRASAGVIAITEDFVPLLREDFGVPVSKISVIPNWAPLEEMPVRPKDNDWSRAHGLAEQFVYLYTGTLGMKHNPALLLELARRHEAEERVRVVVISEGLGADWLREQTAQRPCRSLLQLPYQKFEDLPQVLAAGDVLVGVLEEDAGVFSVPSKILSYLCAQRPVLLAAPAVNLASRIVAAQRAGRVVAPSARNEFLEAAAELKDDSAQAAAMARAGRLYAERFFDIDLITSRFESLLGGGAGARSLERVVASPALACTGSL